MLYTLGLLIGMLILIETGRRIGLRRMAEDSEGARAGIGTVEGALLALLGLLIAFSFSGAAARFDARRQQIVTEANAIGSAYVLIDLLPPEAQPPLKEKFRQYVDSRLEAYRRMPDIAAANVEFERSKALQNDIWAQAVAATRDGGYQPVALQILPGGRENVQYLDRANCGALYAFADDRFRHARRTDADLFAAGGLRNGERKITQLAAYRRLLS